MGISIKGMGTADFHLHPKYGVLRIETIPPQDLAHAELTGLSTMG
jgi:hypothetical protein